MAQFEFLDDDGLLTFTQNIKSKVINSESLLKSAALALLDSMYTSAPYFKAGSTSIVAVDLGFSNTVGNSSVRFPIEVLDIANNLPVISTTDIGTVIDNAIKE